MKLLDINRELIHEGDFDSMRQLVDDANLGRANLAVTNLRGADLRGALGIIVFKSNESGRLFFFVDGDDIKAQAGCFWGTIQELKDKIKEEGKESTHWDYLMACDWAERAWKSGVEVEE